MDNDYEMPLFEWYDIRVEFDRWREWILDGMRTHWLRVQNDTDQELVQRYWRSDAIVPIEFYPWPHDVEKRELKNGSFKYTVRIHYSGDDQLWRLYPRRLEPPLPLGEILRGCLVLSLFANDDAGAEGIVRERLVPIKEILDEQRALIKDFHKQLRGVIRSEARYLRGWTGPNSPSGRRSKVKLHLVK